MCQLAIHLVRNGALLQHDDDVARLLGNRRDMEIDNAFARHARRRKVDLVFVDGRTAMAHLLDERQQGAAERHHVA